MISAILPCHNEPKVYETIDNLEKINVVDEIVIVSDRYGKGKGWAIRDGINKSKGDILILLDADMNIHPKEIEKMISYISDYDVIIGTKKISSLPMLRKIVSLGYRFMVRALFSLDVSDTQTGLKIWKRKVIGEFKENGFAYDIEMLCSYKGKIKEIPIDISNISRYVSLKSIIVTFWATVKIKIRQLYGDIKCVRLSRN